MKRIPLAFLLLALPSTAAVSLAQRADVEKESMARHVTELQAKLGDAYHVRWDEQRKIVMLSDLPETAIDGYLERLRQYQDALHATFFDHLPDYWILVVIPANANDYVKKLGGSAGDAGFYNSAARTLTVNIATGTGTMVHEWTHAMNIADQTARRQSQPLWILEGFGSLYEQVGIMDGHPVGSTNWRLANIQNMIQNGNVMPMRDFIVNSRKYFEKDAIGAYAQTRYIFYYLQEKNLLQKFYRTYVGGYAEDPTGIVALETVLGMKVEDWIGDWRQFTLGLTFGNIQARPTMGIQFDATGGQLRIVKVIEGSGAEKAGLRIGDLIITVDGEGVTSIENVQKLLAGKHRGDEITLQLTRNGESKQIKVTLQ
jgi:PDZ domain-containing protein